MTLRRLLAATVAGALVALALPTVIPIWGKVEILRGGALMPLALLGLLPLLWALEGTTPKQAFFIGWWAGLSYLTVAIWWVFTAMNTFGGITVGLSLVVLYLLIGYLSAYWGLACGLTRHAVDRLGLPLWVVFPIVWTATEIGRNYVFSGFPWGNLGYTVARDLLAVQFASLFGVYGLAFLIAMCAAALYDLTRRWRPRAAAIVLVVGLVLPHAYGLPRLHAIDREIARAPSIRVALLQGNIDQKIKNASKLLGPMTYYQYRDFVLDRYVALTRKADQEGADLIAWPEASMPGELPSHPTEIEALVDQPLRAALLIGSVTLGWEHHKKVLANAALTISREWRVLGEYDKHHLVPFGEYVPLEKELHLPIQKVVPDIGFFDHGDELNLLAVDVPGSEGDPPRNVKFGTFICYDALFPEIGVEFARQDPDFLMNITNDAWYGYSSAPYQFLSMVAVRAVETGKAMARPANTGITAFIDPAGRVVSRTELGLVEGKDDVDVERAIPPELLWGRVPLLHSRTPYVVIGDTFAYICAALTLAFWVAARRTNHADRRKP
jgi:apolipoprotein N-acyltransferase